MANTERLIAIQHVRALQTQIADTLDSEKLTTHQRNLLDDLYDHLMEMDTSLLMKELSADIQGLKKKSDRLNALNKRSKKHLAKLKKLADAIDTTAKVIGKLTKAMALLAEIGLTATGTPV